MRPVLPAVLPWATSRRSSTTTFTPSPASVIAVNAPQIPPPTMATSQSVFSASGGKVAGNPSRRGQNGREESKSIGSAARPTEEQVGRPRRATGPQHEHCHPHRDREPPPARLRPRGDFSHAHLRPVHR